MGNDGYIFCIAHREELETPNPLASGPLAGQGVDFVVEDADRLIFATYEMLREWGAPRPEWMKRYCAVIRAFLARHANCRIMLAHEHGPREASKIRREAEETEDPDNPNRFLRWDHWFLPYDDVLMEIPWGKPPKLERGGREGDLVSEFSHRPLPPADPLAGQPVTPR